MTFPILLVIMVTHSCVTNVKGTVATSCRHTVCRRLVGEPCGGALAAMDDKLNTSMVSLEEIKTKHNVCLKKCAFNIRDLFAGVILRRQDGSVNFNRTWDDYRCGFGDAKGEFWLGLEKMHLLTTSGSYSLLVDLKDFPGNELWAQYSTFSVAGEDDNYRLNVTGYNPLSTTKGDSLNYHNRLKFSAPDRGSHKGCALHHSAGWWYNKCFFTCPTCQYPGIKWLHAFRDWRNFQAVTFTLTPN